MNELIKIQSWEDVRNEVKAINPTLAKLIDNISPKKTYDFIRVRYGYGQSIINNGELQLPLSTSETAPISNSKIPEFIKNRLSYSYVPIAIILNKSAEIFYESPERVMPTKICNAGTMFGLWEVFDPVPNSFTKRVWNITAGARTLFMLPKISDQSLHKHLQIHYGTKIYQPKRLLEHHKVFSEIANSPLFKNKWTNEILFFCKSWHPNESNLIARELHNFWLNEAWKQSFNCRRSMSFDMAWEHFSNAVTKRNMKPKPLIVNTIKHLLAIQAGDYPGYAPTIDDNCAPASLLKKAYTEIYKVKMEPIIMEPVHLSKIDRPAYYSLQLPSLIEYAPGGHGKNIITDLRELKILVDMLEYPLLSEKNFLFFHTEEDPSLNIYNTKKIPEFDQNFLLKTNTKKNLEFPSNSPFLKGCIQISKKINLPEKQTSFSD